MEQLICEVRVYLLPTLQNKARESGRWCPAAASGWQGWKWLASSSNVGVRQARGNKGWRR